MSLVITGDERAELIRLVDTHRSQCKRLLYYIGYMGGGFDMLTAMKMAEEIEESEKQIDNIIRTPDLQKKEGSASNSKKFNRFSDIEVV